ncbi:MAG: protein kinase [Gemmatimonadaceae bacterium]|nr:protein kinase [Gemmatimonadaceae bacterium]
MTSTELTPGQTFGGYRIQHLLGRGGMGAVYAAEQIEDGRLVAVKVLASGLERAEDRERFLREGRTAASVNHPNTVYVYRTEEIDGRPTIAMELVEGGTLEQKVEAQGPLSIADAIADTLQLIDGLEAAHRRGILHRDIKPANCFIGNDGTVKVGDFGLSRPVESVEQGRLTQTGLFLGTPVFSSPEQLMGEALDVRADIYAVGATLYYLLTGKLPFDADNAVKLIAVVMSGAPTPLAQHRQDVPPALDAVVMKCLARNRDERFVDYAALRAALLASRPVEHTPAPIVRRLGAGVIDSYLISTLTLPILGLLKPFGVSVALTANDPRYAMVQALCALPFELLIYGVLEGLTGWTPAKRLLGLRTIRADGGVPGIARAVLRGLFVIAPGLLAVLASRPLATDKTAAAIVVMTISIGGFLLLFARARKANGWLAEHDRLTGTRVVTAHSAAARDRDVTSQVQMLPVHHAVNGRIGAYEVTGAIDANGSVLLASDGALQRPVWIVQRAVDSAPLTEAERQTSRITCARWIGGRRTADEAWDAYAAVGGTPLATRLSPGATWGTVHAWLTDLLDELRARRDAGLPLADLSAADVLITDDGHAVVLPFRVGSGTTQDSAAGHAASDVRVNGTGDAGPLPASVARLLRETLRGALTDWPLRAQAVISAMEDPAARLDALHAALTAAGTNRPPLTAQRRLLLAVATAAPMLGMGFVSSYGATVVAPRDPDLDRLQPLVDWLDDSVSRAPDQRAARGLVGVYIAGHLRDAVVRHREGRDSAVVRTAGIAKREWALADSVVRANPMVSADRLTEADRLVDSTWRGRPPGVKNVRWLIALFTAAAVSGLGAVFALIAAVTVRRGMVLRIMGLDLVTAAGKPAGRLRLTVRQVVTWMPWTLLMVGGIARLSARTTPAWAVPVLLLGIVLAVIAIALALRTPARGLAERLSGTRLVSE